MARVVRKERVNATTAIAFFVQGEPKAQPRPRAFAMNMGKDDQGKDKYQARMYDAGTAEGWKSCVATAAKEFIPTEPLSVPLRVTLVFYMPRPKSHFRTNGTLKDSAPIWFTSKPDTDNLSKAVLDALTILGMWRDDSLVVKSTVVKAYCGKRTGCDVCIEAMDATEHVGIESWEMKGDSVVANLL